jgi:hypothetical protein
MAQSRYGKEVWEKALQEAGIKLGAILATDDVDDTIALKVVGSLCKIQGLDLPTLGDHFGDFWISEYTQKVYPHYYRFFKNARELLTGVDKIVHENVAETIPNARPPRFECTWKDEKTLIMRYISHRGLIDFAVGIIKGVGKHYKENLKVQKIGKDTIEVTFL